MAQNLYNFSINDIDGNLINFNEFQGKPILLVNTASRCGFTKQYANLSNLHREYLDKNLIIISTPSNSFKQELLAIWHGFYYESHRAMMDVDALPSRSHQVASLRGSVDKPYDVIVVGGGATGVGCAMDAASRGLSVALVERGDFASGTSSKSTKLIHGGVRYLEKAFFNLDYGQYKLVREALHERNGWMDIAPHLSSWWVAATDTEHGSAGRTPAKVVKTEPEAAKTAPMEVDVKDVGAASVLAAVRDVDRAAADVIGGRRGGPHHQQLRPPSGEKDEHEGKGEVRPGGKSVQNFCEWAAVRVDGPGHQGHL